MSSDTDNGSLYGGFIDLALGSDLDGLSDKDLNEELENFSDEDANVTVKESIPSTTTVSKLRKLSSVLVVPEATQRTINDLLPKTHTREKSQPTSYAKEEGKEKKVPRNSANKRTYNRSSSNGQQKDSLVKMLARADNKNKQVQKQLSSTPKRIRSPAEESNNSDPHLFQNAKRRISIQSSTPPGESKQIEKSQKSWEQKDGLDLKICLANNVQPSGRDLSIIKKFLASKIEEAIQKKEFVPIFTDSSEKTDGVYVWCSDAPCAKWLYKVTCNKIPDLASDVIIVPQSQVIQIIPRPRMIKTLVTVPTRNNNDQILVNFAQLNKHINTEKWNICHRRFKGATKTTIYLKMDKESFDIIEKQGLVLNWILGKVDVVEEKRKPKSSRAKSTSGTSPTNQSNH